MDTLIPPILYEEGSSLPTTEERGLWDIGKITNWSQQYLHSRGFPSARLDSELLLAKTLDLSRLGLYTNYNRPVTAEEQKRFGILLRRRLRGEPVAYVLGHKEFMGLHFRVGPEVLIPRPETELVVEQAIVFLEKQRLLAPSAERLRVLDVGTGSGCLAIAIAKACPFVEVVAWDICEKALGVACANARDLGVGERLGFYCLDALLPSSWVGAREFTLIVSNPPYVSKEELLSVAGGVKDFEPQKALLGGDDGLQFYRIMAEYAGARLKPAGQMLWEIGANQGAESKRLLAAFAWRDVEVLEDYSRLDRVVRTSVQ